MFVYMNIHANGEMNNKFIYVYIHLDEISISMHMICIDVCMHITYLYIVCIDIPIHVYCIYICVYICIGVYIYIYVCDIKNWEPKTEDDLRVAGCCWSNSLAKTRILSCAESCIPAGFPNVVYIYIYTHVYIYIYIYTHTYICLYI